MRGVGELQLVPIDSFFVINQSGVPIFSQNFNPRDVEMDLVLISGFFNAIHQFSSNIVDKTSKSFDINYGDRTVIFLSRENIMFVAIVPHKTTDLGDFLHNISSVFLSMYNDLDFDVPIENDPQLFSKFREILLDHVLIQLSDNLTPLLLKPIEAVEPIEKQLATELRSRKNIEKISKTLNVEKSRIHRILLNWWTLGYIEFSALPALNDILVRTPSYVRFLMDGSAERKKMPKKIANTESQIYFLFSLLDGTRTLREILLEFPREERKGIYSLLDWLHRQKAVRRRSYWERQTLKTQKLIKAALSIAYNVYSSSTVNEVIQEQLEKKSTNVVGLELRLSSNGKYEILHLPELYHQTSLEFLSTLSRSWLIVLEAMIMQFVSLGKLDQFTKLYLDFLEEIIPERLETELISILDRVLFIFEASSATIGVELDVA